MVIRHLFAGFFLVIGLAAATVIGAAMLLSVQLDTGQELMFALAGLGGAALMLLLGILVLVTRR